jgi:hypothetical protein
MLHKFRVFLFAILALGAFAATPAFSRATQVVTTRPHHRYFVEYGAGRVGRVMGPYHSHRKAHAVAQSLRLQGFRVHVVQR